MVDLCCPHGVVLFKYPEEMRDNVNFSYWSLRSATRVVLSRKKRIRSTLPKTNIKPENGWLGDYCIFGPGLFSGAMLCSLLFFGSVYRGKKMGHYSLDSVDDDNPKLTDIHWAVIVKHWYWYFGFACSMPGEIQTYSLKWCLIGDLPWCNPYKVTLKKQKLVWDQEVFHGKCWGKNMKKTTSNPNVWIWYIHIYL